MQHESKQKHKKALLEYTLSTHEVIDLLCTGVRLTGKSRDGLLSKLFDALVRYWPQHNGCFNTTLLPEFAADSPGVASVTAIRVQHSLCTGVCVEGAPSCPRCASLVRNRQLGQRVAAWEMLVDLLEYHSLLLSGDEVSASHFAENDLQQRLYRQVGFEYLGQDFIRDILEKHLTDLKVFLHKQWSRKNLWTYATKQHYELYVKDMLGPYCATPLERVRLALC